MLTFLHGAVLSTPKCVIETKKEYDHETWSLVVTRSTATCGEYEKVVLPMDPPEEGPDCTSCENILILKNIEGNSVPRAAFKNYNTTTKLYLDNLGIEMISPSAFVPLKKLKDVHLAGNKLTSIYEGVFKDLEKLESLDLSSNQIHSLKDISLNGTKILSSVNLSSNFLTAIETDKAWNNITVLDLSNNKINKLDAKVLPQNITVLNVSSNSLTTFNIHKNFSELDLANNNLEAFDLSWINYTMKRLNLKNNQINQIFGSYCTIKEIDLSGNKLNTVPCDCTNKSPVVEYLNLANNVISTVTPQTIAELTNLKELHLEFNQLKVIKAGTFASLQKLVYLNLSHNIIENFEMGSVDNIKNVELFDVSYNRLKQLKRYMMHTFANLKHLHLEYNNLTYINGSALNDDLPKIWDINIVGNNLTCHNIWNIIWIFNKRPVHFTAGPFKNVTNVHGMRCYFPGNTTEDDLGSSFDELDINNGIADYFNHDYRESNFFKFLEDLQYSVSTVFNETWSIRKQMEKVFRQNSKLEHLTSDGNSSGFNGYLITILLFLIVITSFIGFQVYILYSKFRTHTNDDERLL